MAAGANSCKFIVDRYAAAQQLWGPEGDAVTDRRANQILDEWRELERELETGAADHAERAAIAAKIAALRLEYQQLSRFLDDGVTDPGEKSGHDPGDSGLTPAPGQA